MIKPRTVPVVVDRCPRCGRRKALQAADLDALVVLVEREIAQHAKMCRVLAPSIPRTRTEKPVEAS